MSYTSYFCILHSCWACYAGNGDNPQIANQTNYIFSLSSRKHRMPCLNCFHPFSERYDVMYFYGIFESSGACNNVILVVIVCLSVVPL